MNIYSLDSLCMNKLLFYIYRILLTALNDVFIWNKIMFSLQLKRNENTTAILSRFKEDVKSKLNLNDIKSLEQCQNVAVEAFEV